MDIGKGDIVRFTVMADPLNGDESPVMVDGIVFRAPWGRAQNISIRTTEDTPRTFVRGPADVEIVQKAKIQLTEQPDGSITEADADVAWVRDSYTEPREHLFRCCVCETEIEDWHLMTCLDGGEAAHRDCVTIRKAAP